MAFIGVRTMINSFFNKHHNLSIGIIAVVISFLVLLSCSCVTSFLYSRVPDAAYYNDGVMFYIMGSSFAKGYTPYIDIYDHKGLYIFYYTAIGGLLGRTGVFFFALILLSVTMYFIFKTVELHTDKWWIIFISIFLFASLYAFSGQSPNDSDMEMPFNAVMVYFYVRALKRKEDKDFYIGNVFAGISAGIAINLRMSDALIPFAFTAFILICSIMQKKIKFLFLNAGIVVGGIILMSIPPFLPAYLGGFINDMVDAVFVSNFSYIATSNVKEGHQVFAYILVPTLVAFYFLLLFFKRKEFEKEFIVFIGVTMGIALFIELVIANYPHYFIVMYPYISVSIVLCALPYLQNENEVNKVGKGASVGLLAITLGAFIFNPVLYGMNDETNLANIAYINNTIDEEGKNGHTLIFCSPAYYLSCDIKVGYGDFACQRNHSQLSKRFSTENLIAYLDSESSQYVILDSNSYPFVESLFNELTNNHYEAIASPAGASITIYHRA